MGGTREQREAVLRRMLRLADRRCNDSVRLVFLKDEQAEEIGRMDLGALTEVKRHGNGAVELKLVDRAEILEKLYGMLKDGGDEEMRAFLEAAGTGKDREAD